jgi:hypothetical protein
VNKMSVKGTWKILGAQFTCSVLVQKYKH